MYISAVMAKYDFLKAQFSKPISQRIWGDHTAKDVFDNFDPLKDELDKKSDEIFDRFAELTDPTSSRKGHPYKYLGWIISAYLKEMIQAEDLYKIRNDIRDFETWSAELKTDGVKNEIHQYETLFDLREAIKPYQRKRDAKAAERRRRQMDREELQKILDHTTVIYKGPEGKIVMPHNEAACKHWGDQTRWCISARNNNAFKSHNDKHSIIIYIPVKNEDEREKENHYYTSNKFAAVSDLLFDEHDKANNPYVPPSLKRLKDAALRKLEGRAYSYIKEFGLSDVIDKKSSDPADIKNTRDFFSPYDDPQDKDAKPEWDELLTKVCDHGVDHWAEQFVIICGDLLENKEFLEYVLKRKSYVFSSLPPSVRDDEALVEIVFSDSVDFSKCSERLRNDREFVLKWIDKSTYTLKALPEHLRADPEIVEKALKNHGSQIEHVFPAQVHNEWRLKEIFKAYALPLIKGLPNLRDNKELALIALNSGYGVFEHLSPRLRGDKDLYKEFGDTVFGFQSAARSIRSDREIVTDLAMNGRADDFKYVPRRLRHNKKFLLELLEKGADPHILSHVSKRIILDRNFAMKAVAINGKSLGQFIIYGLFESKRPFENDRELVKIAVKQNGKALRYTDKLRDDKEIITEAVKSNGDAIEYVSHKHLTQELIDLAITSKRPGLKALHEILYDRDRHRRKLDFSIKEELAIKALEIDGLQIAHLEDQSDTLCRAAIEQNPEAIRHISPDAVHKYAEFALQAISADLSLLEHVRNKTSLLANSRFTQSILPLFIEQGMQEQITPSLRFVNELQGDIDAISDPLKAREKLDSLDLSQIELPSFYVRRYGRNDFII